MMESPLLELRDFRYTYLAGTPRAREAIRGISLTIERGERVAIIGPTEAGKSTLVAALVHLLRLPEGQVYYEGQDITGDAFDRQALRRTIGVLFQDANSQLVEDVVGKDVAFGPTAAGLSASETRQRVEDSLNAVGLPYSEFRLRYTHALSGGQRKRVALAGLLAMQPPVLVLDEPLAGLDPLGQHELLEVLTSVADEPGRTMIVCSTSLTGAALLCRRAVVLDGGHVVRDQPLVELLHDLDDLASLQISLPETVILARALRRVLPGFPVDLLQVRDVSAEILRRLERAS